MLVRLLDRYRHKLKSAEELRDIIGPRPRARSGQLVCYRQCSRQGLRTTMVLPE